MTIIGRQLADGQLSDAEGDLYVVPVDTRVYLKSIVCSNVGAGDNTVSIYLRPSGGTSRRIAYATMNSGDTMYYSAATTLDTGDSIRGVATNADEVDFVISGGEEAT